MKKIKLNSSKLQLNKEKIATLTNAEMNNVNGGGILWSRIGCCQSVIPSPPKETAPPPATQPGDGYCPSPM